MQKQKLTKSNLQDQIKHFKELHSHRTVCFPSQYLSLITGILTHLSLVYSVKQAL